MRYNSPRNLLLLGERSRPTPVKVVLANLNIRSNPIEDQIISCSPYRPAHDDYRIQEEFRVRSISEQENGIIKRGMSGNVQA